MDAAGVWLIWNGDSGISKTYLRFLMRAGIDVRSVVKGRPMIVARTIGAQATPSPSEDMLDADHRAHLRHARCRVRACRTVAYR